MIDERIKTILKNCKKNANKCDLHSFTADYSGGRVFVNYAYNFNIIIFIFNKEFKDIRKHYSLNLEQTALLLTKLKIKNISL